MSKLECFVWFADVNYWLSRTRDLIATAETCSYPAFQEEFRQLRRRTRKAEFGLVIALFKFQREMKGAANDHQQG